MSRVLVSQLSIRRPVLHRIVLRTINSIRTIRTQLNEQDATEVASILLKIVVLINDLQRFFRNPKRKFCRNENLAYKDAFL